MSLSADLSGRRVKVPLVASPPVWGPSVRTPCTGWQGRWPRALGSPSPEAPRLERLLPGLGGPALPEPATRVGAGSCSSPEQGGLPLEICLPRLLMRHLLLPSLLLATWPVTPSLLVLCWLSGHHLLKETAPRWFSAEQPPGEQTRRLWEAAMAKGCTHSLGPGEAAGLPILVHRN